eukprot:353931-Chlamydomonas_euryale.AAC.1
MSSLDRLEFVGDSSPTDSCAWLLTRLRTQPSAIRLSQEGCVNERVLVSTVFVSDIEPPQHRLDVGRPWDSMQLLVRFGVDGHGADGRTLRKGSHTRDLIRRGSCGPLPALACMVRPYMQRAGRRCMSRGHVMLQVIETLPGRGVDSGRQDHMGPLDVRRP